VARWLAGAILTALDRLVAFAEAGADCLFAPGVKEPSEIREIVLAVSPKPVNVIVPSHIPGLTLESLASLGDRRISVGSALSRVAWGAFLKAAGTIKETGEFGELSKAASFAEVNGIFANQRV
jgi:2-methylisocitrate lyase-like PEP mutase family enzyme